jgi:divalent metal cation (Fe/Co/Zn/Cd) transporter
MDEVKRTEAHNLKVARYAMLTFAVLGFVAYGLSGSAAVQIDGFYALINAASALIATWLSVVGVSAATQEYPYGRGAFENVYVLFRSMMILALIVFALIENTITIIEYFVTGKGEEPVYSIVVIYGFTIGFACVALAIFHGRANARLGGRSELLKVERQVAIIDGTLAFGLAVTLGLVSLIPAGTFVTSDSFNIQYIADSLVVLVIAAALFAEPYRMMRGQLGRLTGKRVDLDLEAELLEAVNETLRDEQTFAGFAVTDIYAVRRGKSIEVHVCITFPGEKTVADLDQVQELASSLFRDEYGAGRIYVSFSARKIYQL